jgi:hypothetical protein
MCDVAQVFASLRHEGREREFYPWYAIRCLLMGQDCYRIAYTYNVKEADPEAFKIIDGMPRREAEALITSLLERLEEEPSLGDFVKALAVNHLYLKHEHDDRVLSGELLNKLVRKYGWSVVGVLLGAVNDVIETHKCVGEPSLMTWQAVKQAYGGVFRGGEKSKA